MKFLTLSQSMRKQITGRQKGNIEIKCTSLNSLTVKSCLFVGSLSDGFSFEWEFLLHKICLPITDFQVIRRRTLTLKVKKKSVLD